MTAHCGSFPGLVHTLAPSWFVFIMSPALEGRKLIDRSLTAAWCCASSLSISFALHFVFGVVEHRTLTRHCSGFNVPDGPNFPHGMPGFSLHSTEPTQGNDSGLSWSSEGQQYLHQNSTGPHGTSHNGYPDSFISYQAAQEATHGNSIVRGSVSGSSRSQWNNEPSAAHLEAVEMTRFPSQDSTGAQSQRTTNSYDQGRSTRMYSAVSQMPYQMQSTDAVGRSHSPDGQSLYAATPLDMQTFDHIQYPGGNFAGAHPMYHRGSNASNASHPMSLTTGSSYNSYPIMGGESLVAAGPNIIVNQGPVPADSLTYHSGSIIESPTLWDNNGIEFLDSQRSSPTQLEDPWSLPLPQMATSATNSPFQHSPSIDGISPRYVQDLPHLVELAPYTTGDRVTRKPIGPRPSKVASDMAAASRRQHFQGNHPGTSEASDESFKFGGRSSLDLDNTARDHFLYQNVTPQADGLYHCPFEKEPGSNCQHKPEKLKCNYEYDPFPCPFSLTLLTILTVPVNSWIRTLSPTHARSPPARTYTSHPPPASSAMSVKHMRCTATATSPICAPTTDVSAVSPGMDFPATGTCEIT